MFRVAGFPTRVYRSLASRDKQRELFDKIPKPYLDLNISSYAVHVWHCWFESDKLNLFLHTTGDTQEEAETLMFLFTDKIEKAKQSFMESKS
jgi:hypothetical protein